MKSREPLLESFYGQSQGPSSQTWRPILEAGLLETSSANNEMDLPVSSSPKNSKKFDNECPWKNEIKEYTFDMEGLNEEINDFYEFLKPKPCEVRMRKEVVDNIKGIIATKWPELEVCVIGSFQTQLFLPTSDIDIVILGAWPSLPQFLAALEAEIRNADIAEPKSILVLDKVKIPIIKLVHKQTRLKIDIGFNSYTGIKSVRITLLYMEQYPFLCKLLFVIKEFLTEHQLNEVYKGGIGSYTLVLLITSFLQLHPKKSSILSQDLNLGELLIEFFELYGRRFNYQNVGIHLYDGGGYFPKSQLFHGDSLSDGMLCVMDPTDLNCRENTARGSYNILNARKAFEHAFVCLSRAVLHREPQVKSKRTILGLIMHINKQILQHRDWIKERWSDKPLTENDFPTPVPTLINEYDFHMSGFYPNPILSPHHQWVPTQPPVFMPYSPALPNKEVPTGPGTNTPTHDK